MISTLLNISMALTIISGSAVAVDGDTIKLNGETIRLLGIDAPELRQTCFRGKSITYLCGETARKFLTALIDEGEIQCDIVGVDKYKRKLGRCLSYTLGMELGYAMVRHGQARVYMSKVGWNYSIAEGKAAKDKVGIWAGEHEPPWEFRRRMRKNKNKGE